MDYSYRITLRISASNGRMEGSMDALDRAAGYMAGRLTAQLPSVPCPAVQPQAVMFPDAEIGIAVIRPCTIIGEGMLKKLQDICSDTAYNWQSSTAPLYVELQWVPATGDVYEDMRGTKTFIYANGSGRML